MNDNKCQCSCNTMTKLPVYTALTMAYVPFQTELETYTSAEALNNGTLFPELNKNFYGGNCCG